MEDQCSPLNWGYCYQEEGIEELKHCLLYTTLELERTILTAHEEIARKEDELIHYKGLLSKILKERDEAQDKCKSLILEKAILQEQQLKLEQEIMLQRHHPEEEEEEEGQTSEPSTDEQEEEAEHEDDHDKKLINSCLVVKKPLPENGKFLQAVMEAGPLLQTLLLADPLPQWQHPPPQLNSKEIPPVKVNMKRGVGGIDLVVECQAPEFSPKSKVPKVVHPYPLTNC